MFCYLDSDRLLAYLKEKYDFTLHTSGNGENLDG